MLTTTLLAVAFVVNVTALQPAHANADPDNDFLSKLDWYGIDISELMGHPISRHDTIDLGHVICDDLHRGTPPEAEMNVFYRGMPKITDKQAGNLVSAAQFAICPDTL
jgi:hypothetical protein